MTQLEHFRERCEQVARDFHIATDNILAERKERETKYKAIDECLTELSKYAYTSFEFSVIRRVQEKYK
jgi:hypothetical protein